MDSESPEYRDHPATNSVRGLPLHRAGEAWVEGI